MKPANNATRDEFIRTMNSWEESRLQINNLVRQFTPREQSIFAAGWRDGVSTVLSATDSREDNGAKFRITDLNGDCISFYPVERPTDGSVTLDQVTDQPGIIVAIFPHSPGKESEQ